MKNLLNALRIRRKNFSSSGAEGFALCFQDHAKDLIGHVEMRHCVGHLYFGFGSQGWNPFTIAVKEYLQNGSWQTLARFYEIFQPGSLAEAYFMRCHPRWGVLNAHSPFVRLKPWRSSELLMSGHEGPGNQNFGPVTNEKLEYEIRRYERIIHSIRRHGYNPRKFETIQGYFLLNQNGKYVFRVTQGMHRMPVLDAMGQEKIPVSFDPRMPRYICLSSLQHWPRVTDGTFSPQQASYLFNRHFWDRGNIKKRLIGAQL